MEKRQKAFKYLLWKRYFDTGLGLTSYAKYIIALLGIYSIKENLSFNYILLASVLYIIFCFIIGYLWYKHRLIDIENEIGNTFNPFQVEVRKKLNGKRFK